MSTHEEVVTPHADHLPHSRVIAIAIDESKFSEFAFDWTLANIVRPESDQIVLLHVRPVISAPTVYATTIAVDLTSEAVVLENANRKHSHELLQSFANRVSPKAFNLRGVGLRGDPREEIPLKVAELRVDVLVVGNRGLSKFKESVLGSVSQFLVHHSQVPVIVAHPPQIEN
ncbi:UNVERIFIED_CONTAM: hypothetical protein HDU68_011893 [Siphonaria sp. JEL0065]|nr:hypothetical protein HDU68_011893 [Siphonaria sp. JEL0065]